VNAASNQSTHLLLVSAQATPNLTPALDPAVRPDRVILLVSPDMTRRADWLQAVLARRGIRVDRWTIADAWDLEHIQFRVLELLEAERVLVKQGAVALNVTGGTKPMAIAAFDAFRAYELPVYYVHPEHDRLIWIHPAARPNVSLANRIRLDDFLAAHGATLLGRRDQAIAEPLRALTAWLVEQNQRIARPLATLNWLASHAEGALRSPVLEQRQMRDQGLAELLRRFAEHGLLRIEDARVRFPGEAQRFYVNGGWLEEHVYDTLRGLRGELRDVQDLARSMDIVREGSRGEVVPNEIDVACLADNRLYVIECKTRGWDDGSAAGPGADALYRLDSLSDLLGGLQARAMLISYRDLPHHVLRRAADLRIQVCAGKRLPELHAVLRAWIAPNE
jgi:hypothetical protein